MHTITKASEIDELFKAGRRVSHPALLVLFRHTPDGAACEGRVLFVAGKRLGPAVLRNRCKRVMRHAVRRVGGPWPGWDVALIAREQTAGSAAATLDRAVSRALESAGIAP